MRWHITSKLHSYNIYSTQRPILKKTSVFSTTLCKHHKQHNKICPVARIQFEYCKLFSCIWCHALILFVKINIIYCLIVSTNMNVIQRSEKNKTKVYLLFCKALRCN